MKISYKIIFLQKKIFIYTKKIFKIEKLQCHLMTFFHLMKNNNIEIHILYTCIHTHTHTHSIYILSFWYI